MGESKERGAKRMPSTDYKIDYQIKIGEKDGRTIERNSSALVFSFLRFAF